MPGALFAFEGLDQSGKETQARLLAAAPRGRRPAREGRDVSRLRDGHRHRAVQGAARRARLRRRRHPDADDREPVRVEAGHRAGARRGDDRDRRSLPRVERRLRRGAGPRSALAVRRAEVPAGARPDPDDRHRAGDRRCSKAHPPRSLRAGSADARRGCAPATGGRRRRPDGWRSTANGRSTPWPPTWLPRRRQRSGRGKRPHLARPHLPHRQPRIPAASHPSSPDRPRSPRRPVAQRARAG